MDKHNHWQNIYLTKQVTDVSWFKLHLDKSLDLIDSVDLNLDAHIIDVGGGASNFVDDLLARGFKNLTVLDISSAALDKIKQRLADKASTVS